MATAVVLCSFATWSAMVSHFGGALRPLSGLNAPLYDLSLSLAGRLRRREWSRTLIVLIDQRTLDSPGWASVPRALQQPQLGRLANAVLSLGATRVGFDLVIAFDPARITLPYSLFSAYDATFTSLLRTSGGQLVLGTDASIGPADRYADLLPRTSLGAIDLATESDGVVRSVLTRTRLNDGRRVLGFAQALAGAAGDPASSHAFIVPHGPTDTIPHLSASALEQCLGSPEGASAVASLVRGRIVLIGAGLAGEDSHQGPDGFVPELKSTPGAVDPCRIGALPIESREPGRLPGVFLQAAATESLLDPSPLRLANALPRVATNLGIALLALAALARVDLLGAIPDRRGWMFAGTLRAGLALVAFVVVFGIAAVGLEAAALLLASVWLPLGPVLAATGLVCVSQTMILAIRRDIALADLRISFGRWLPPPVIKATLGASPMSVSGRERVITVLIADLMNFTSFCAAYRGEPAKIVTALNRKFTAAQAVIDRHGGCLDKFDGDAVIAFWNGIDDQPDHARRAVAAAREIVAADLDDDALRFKCAVATGVAFVGCYGSDLKSSFSAIGEPMNLAARLETMCREHRLRIVIAESTREACRTVTDGVPSHDEPSLSEKIGEARLKGFSDPVPFFTVDEESPSRGRAPSLANPFAVEHEA